MKTLELHVPDEIAMKLENAAQARGMSLEEFIEEKLAQDAAFESAANEVLAKNAELYKRLA